MNGGDYRERYVKLLFLLSITEPHDTEYRSQNISLTLDPSRGEREDKPFSPREKGGDEGVVSRNYVILNN